MTAFSFVFIAVELAGIVTALLVIYARQHRSRGAVAWVIALLGLPWVALPLYWMSGKVRYGEYQRSKEQTLKLLDPILSSLAEPAPDDSSAASLTTLDPLNTRRGPGEASALERFSTLRDYSDNATLLYSETERAWDDIKLSLEAAEKYILLQSYLLRDDDLGRQIGEILKRAGVRGCDVFVLYDELGSDDLSAGFVDEMRDAGVHIRGFSETRRFLPKIRMNFRNHRKVLVIDGVVGFVGGMNLGEEYLDGADQFCSWRDTHLRIVGSAVLTLQLGFVTDWRFACKGDAQMRPHELSWQRNRDQTPTQKSSHSKSETGDKYATSNKITVCDIGPDRKILTGDVLFTVLLEAAVTRLWIATPYFVPDDRVISTLKAAAIRGVEIKVIVPRISDHKIFPLVHEEFARELKPYGVEIYAFGPGFMHQKVLLVDDKYACVGSANFDNRSFRLNFEVVAILHGAEPCENFSAMLREDFDKTTLLDPESQADRGLFYRFVSRSTRLLAPVL